jgi:osmotically-inducible protein OsmY
MINEARKFWKRAGWGLAVTCPLVLGMQARAQSPYSPIDVKKPVEKHVQAGVRSGSLREEQHNRDLEIKTQLAWLANPLTFPYALKARVKGSSMEVSGTLPTASLHAEAVRIARDESGMPVKDNIALNAHGAVPPTSKPAQVLSRDINNTLAEAMPRLFESMTVSVWMRGQVVLKGTVATLEDKLAASRCLQGVAGCSCVVNQLQVSRPVIAQAMPWMKSGADLGATAKVTANVKPEQVQILAPQSLRLETPALSPAPSAPWQQTEVQSAFHVVNASAAPAKTAEARPVVMASPFGQPESAQRNDAQPTAKTDATPAVEKGAFSPLTYHATKWRRLDKDRTIMTPKPSTSPYTSQASVPVVAPPVIQAKAEAPETPNLRPDVRQAAAIMPLAEEAAVTKGHEAQISDGIIFFDDTEKAGQPKKDK